MSYRPPTPHTVVLALTLALIAPAPLLGQAGSAGGAEPAANAYEKSPATAGLLEAFTLPTLGYAYAEQWSRGLLPALGQVTGILLVAEQQYCLCIFEEPPPCDGQCVAGIVLAVGSRLWAVIDASATVRRRRASAGIAEPGVMVAPSFRHGRVGVAFRMGVDW